MSKLIAGLACSVVLACCVKMGTVPENSTLGSDGATDEVPSELRRLPTSTRTSTGTGTSTGTTDAKVADSRVDVLPSGSRDSGGKSSDATVVSSNGCGRSGQTTGDFHLSTTDGSGTKRDFEVIVPTGYNPTVPLAVTFVFHGAGGTESNAKSFGLQQAPSAGSASIFVFPQGVDYNNQGVGWNDLCAGYDVAFFDNMLSAIRGAYCVDLNRINVAGFSWGCDFVTALTCCRGDKIHAVAAASCSDEFSNAADYKTYANYPCPTTSAAAIRFTHDSSAKGDSQYTGAQFTATRQLYGALNSCSATSVATTPSPCVSYQSCAHPLVECAYSGLGHALPSNWAADTWNFFSGTP